MSTAPARTPAVAAATEEIQLAAAPAAAATVLLDSGFMTLQLELRATELTWPSRLRAQSVAAAAADAKPTRVFPNLRLTVTPRGPPADVLRGMRAKRMPLAWILVVDISGSVQEYRAILRASVRTMCESLGPKDTVAVVVFNATARVALPWTAAADVTETVCDGVCAQLRPSGRTNLVAAMGAAASLASDAPATPHILLITDGLHNEPRIPNVLQALQDRYPALEHVCLNQLIVGDAATANTAFFAQLQRWCKGLGRAVTDVEVIPTELGEILGSTESTAVQRIVCNGTAAPKSAPVLLETQTLALEPIHVTQGTDTCRVTLQLWDGSTQTLEAPVGELLAASDKRLRSAATVPAAAAAAGAGAGAGAAVSSPLPPPPLSSERDLNGFMDIGDIDARSVQGTGLLFAPCLWHAKNCARRGVVTPLLRFLVHTTPYEFSAAHMQQLRALHEVAYRSQQLKIQPTLVEQRTMLGPSSSDAAGGGFITRLVSDAFVERTTSHLGGGPSIPRVARFVDIPSEGSGITAGDVGRSLPPIITSKTWGVAMGSAGCTRDIAEIPALVRSMSSQA